MKPILSPADQQILDALQQAVTAELDRKARLGHYVVIWQDGRVVLQGPDAPPASATAAAAANPNGPAGPQP
jgi:hypothetical protein